MQYDLGDLLRKAEPFYEEIVQKLYSEAKRQNGKYRIGSIDGDNGRSLVIEISGPKAGMYYDHADPTVRGNILSLMAHKTGRSYRETVEYLAKMVGAQPEEELEDKPLHKADPDLPSKVKDPGPAVLSLAKSRGISEKTLALYGVGSDVGGNHAIFKHFDNDGNLVLIKYWPTNGSKKMYSNPNPLHCLFGKDVCTPERTGGKLVITEGQWDALAWAEAGLPAVSIPSGVSNEDWIRNDWSYLRQFTEILLSFDMDKPGIDGCESAIKRLNPDRCKVIKLEGGKDANDILKLENGKQKLIAAYVDAINRPVDKLVPKATLQKKLLEYLTDPPSRKGTPFFLPGMEKIRFRDYEWTLWYGYTSHGKSAALQNQIMYQAGLGMINMVASFEQQPGVTFGQLMIGFVCDPQVAARPDFQEAYDELSDKIRMFESMRKTSMETIIPVMRMARRQLGCRSFVIDNVMTLDVDRGDMSAQSKAADQLREFVSTEPCHVHVVAHPRKAPDNITKPPGIQEIRGASEWADMPHNVITVYRDVSKHEEMARMESDQSIPIEDIQRFDLATPDGRILVRKQRETGDLPQIDVWFDKTTKRFTSGPYAPEPYWRTNG